jgi:hypothetical protein
MDIFEYLETEEIKVSSENFEISHEDLRHINSRLNYMSDIAPLGSTLRLNFALKDGKYIGNLEVRNIRAQFNSLKDGIVLLDVFKTIEDEVHQKIIDWKQSRFDNESSDRFEVEAIDVNDIDNKE